MADKETMICLCSSSKRLWDASTTIDNKAAVHGWSVSQSQHHSLYSTL